MRNMPELLQLEIVIFCVFSSAYRNSRYSKKQENNALSLQQDYERKLPTAFFLLRFKMWALILLHANRFSCI